MNKQGYINKLEANNLTHAEVLISQWIKSNKNTNQASKNHCLLLVTETALQAQQLSTQLPYFTSLDPQISHFSDWETLPYDHFSAHHDLTAERLQKLAQLQRPSKSSYNILVTHITALMHPTCSPAYSQQQTLQLSVGEHQPLDQFQQQLVNMGYRHNHQVMEPQDFTIRGGMIDLFPLGATEPFRIEWFDDEVDSIRTFDVETQRSIEVVKSINLLPAFEFPLDDTGVSQFRTNFREQFSGDVSEMPIYQSISNKKPFAGIEYYLPLFFDQRYSLFDHLPASTHIIRIGNTLAQAEQAWSQMEQRYESLSGDRTRPILTPQQVFTPTNLLFSQLKQFPQIQIDLQEKYLPTEIRTDVKRNLPLAGLKTYLQKDDKPTLFIAESRGRHEMLLQHLNTINIRPQFCEYWQSFTDSTTKNTLIQSSIAAIDLGFETSEYRIIAEGDLFGHKPKQQNSQQQSIINPDVLIRDLTELSTGAPVVHEAHGVGRYQGLVTLDAAGLIAEYLHLTYADEKSLYVPVCDLHLIMRYSGGSESNVQLHQLGSNKWQKQKAKAKAQAEDVAAELLEIYANRAHKAGLSFSIDDTSYQNFSNEFPFEETPDQLKAIHAIEADMQADKSMDRLVCGDVGFGKTEVAMRAAFIAAINGKQVCVIAPTTLLAEQHHQNFIDRFSNHPINIDGLSRFRTQREQTQILKQLQAGKIDIIVGTHRLLQKDIHFKQLGLVIIDEEQRFGVKQKEALKQLRHEVDILTLTATPIPRTLNMAFSGMRDLSLIGTPPAKRLSIKTFVHEYHLPLIREAITRELHRGGQVYFLHNDVATIEKAAQVIQDLVPESKTVIAHGQLREKELEQVMRDFYHQRFNVLVCSTIIESGIDVPTANTILIERADKLGLSQLHQIRGRVGRSHHQAYAYLLTPKDQRISKDAEKRLEAISNIDALGAGFMLATHDLEIRGAGDILGAGQSGQIQTVGFSLYMQMLEEAVQHLRDGKLTSPAKRAQPTEIALNLPTIIPNDYMPDTNHRLLFYKRIANTNDAKQLDELQAEMIDRFGGLPIQTQHLFAQNRLRFKMIALGITSIKANQQGGILTFKEDTQVEPITLIQLMQKNPAIYKLEPDHRFRFKSSIQETHQIIDVIRQLLQIISPHPC